MLVTRTLPLLVVFTGLTHCSLASSPPLPSETARSESSSLVGANALDPTFGSAGQEIVSAPVTPYDVVIQADGKIVVAGGLNTSPAFAIARLLPNGALDTSFGSGGVAQALPAAQESYVASTALQPDGKIVAAGRVLPTSGSSIGNFAVARFNSDGSLDTTFGSGGSVQTNIPNVFDIPTVVVLQPDGKILLGGYVQTFGSHNSQLFLVLLRYTSTGTLDSSFGSGGIVRSTTQGRIESIGLESDGSILVASPGSPPSVSRFDAGGNPLPVGLFGALSPVKAASSALEQVTMTFTSNGSLVVGASAARPGGKHAGTEARVVEFALTGGLAFDTGGIEWGNGLFGSFEMPEAVGVEPDGEVVAAGVWNPTLPSTAWAATALQASGSLDSSFGSGGIAQVTFGGSSETVTKLAVQPADGKVVIVGTTNAGSGIAASRLIE